MLNSLARQSERRGTAPIQPDACCHCYRTQVPVYALLINLKTGVVFELSCLWLQLWSEKIKALTSS